MIKKLLAFVAAASMLVTLVPSWAAEESDSILNESEDSEVVIKYSTENDDTVTFKVTDFEKYCLEKTGDNLAYVNFTLPASSNGSLWYDFEGDNEEKVTATTKYYRNASSSSYRLIGNVTFVPKASFVGEAEISFKGYSNDRTAFDGKVVVTVKDGVNTGDLDKLTYELEPGDKLNIDSSDINKVCRNAGFVLSYVRFELPAENIGIYYYDYSAADRYNTYVKESTKYYRSSSDSSNYLIDNVTLVTSKDAEDTAELTYYAYDTNDEEYIGIIKIKFDSESSDINYSTNGEVVFINPADINKICLTQTGAKLSYVKFTLPSKGTLYYDYDNEEDAKATVKSSTKYYYSKSPYLYLVGYFPASNYAGTVLIDYAAYNVDGDSCNGSITVKVDTKNIEQADDITYSVKNNSYVTFSAVSEFNTECKNATGERLDYIRFGTVSSGNLYYKYSYSNNSYESKVTSSGRYYYESGDEYLKNVSYVPKSTYTGKATIQYTGYSVEGTSFTGQIKITVTSSGSSSSSSSSDDDEASDIKYSGRVGDKIYFDGADFNAESKDLFLSTLSYVKFKLPSSSYGTLMYNGKEEISSSDKCYYRNEEILISDICFIPEKTGKVTISYTGYSVDGDVFTGNVVITVTSKVADDEKDEKPSEGMGNFGYVTSYKASLFDDIDENAWYGENQTSAVKQAYRYGFVQGKGNKKFDPTGNITIAEAITIAARIADIYYGEETEFTSGDINWYDNYVEYAISKKIIGKNDFTNYDKTATRGEMAYIFANVLPEDEYTKLNNVTSIPDVKVGLKYYDEIMMLYNAGILSGNDSQGTFAPSTNITRAEVSAIVVRIANPEERRENNFN